MRQLLNAATRLALTLWFAFTLTFILLRLTPANALMARLSQTEASPEVIAQTLQQRGLDRPVPEQYLTSLVALLQGDWGTSLTNDQPVVLLLQPRLLNTLMLIGSAAGLSLVVGLGAGVWTVRNNTVQRTVTLISSLSLSMPVYWTATLMLFTVADWFRIGQRSWGLAVGVLVFHLSSILARLIGVILADTGDADFIRFARSKGLSERAVWWRHRLPYAAAPIIAIFTAQISLTLGSTVALEAIFSQPGLGSALLSAVINRDYPVAQVIIMILVFIVVLITTASELLVLWFDPRLRFQA